MHLPRRRTGGRFVFTAALITAFVSQHPPGEATASTPGGETRPKRTFTVRSSGAGSGPRKFLFLGDRTFEGRVEIRIEGDEVFANDRRAYPLPTSVPALDEQREREIDDRAMRIALVRNDVRRGMTKGEARKRFDERVERQLKAIQKAAQPNASKALLERRIRSSLDPGLVETSRRSKRAPQIFPTEDVLIRIFIKDMGWLTVPALGAHESEFVRPAGEATAGAERVYSTLIESLESPGNSVLIMEQTGTLAFRNNRQADDILTQVDMIRKHQRLLSKAELATFSVTLPQRIQRLICVQSGGCAR